ncbi:MAG TPA: F0F1 ATP synthase subunit A [Candidatus Saccharimonadales bacterium]|nr:F0F1 ATP synthase subunit A [Candidatus Saccharimonadales bacterium]
MIHNFAASDIHISLAAEPLFTVGGLQITNAVLLGLVGLGIFIGIFMYVAAKIKRNQYNRFVGLVQWAFEGMYNSIFNVIPDKVLARKIAPLALTIFFFVLISYWLSIIPGIGSITFHGIPVFRSLAADLNFTLAIMLITMVTVQVYAIKQHGVFGNAGRYLRNPFKDPLGSFEGFLELIGEFSRGLSLSLRLFGNCFAGEVLLLIIAVLTSYFAIVALPVFMAFELFIGLVQAYVFFILTLIFTSLAVDTHGHSEAEPSLTSHTDHSPTDHVSTPVAVKE